MVPIGPTVLFSAPIATRSPCIFKRLKALRCIDDRQRSGDRTRCSKIRPSQLQARQTIPTVFPAV